MTLFRRKPQPVLAPATVEDRVRILQAAERIHGAATTRFRPGQSGNPAGRRKGVGVDICEARHIAARTYREAFDGRPLQERAAAIAAEIEAGARDDGPEVRSVLAAIRRGRILGRRAK